MSGIFDDETMRTLGDLERQLAGEIRTALGQSLADDKPDTGTQRTLRDLLQENNRLLIEVNQRLRDLGEQLDSGGGEGAAHGD